LVDNWQNPQGEEFMPQVHTKLQTLLYKGGREAEGGREGGNGQEGWRERGIKEGRRVEGKEGKRGRGGEKRER
jgi:hypothetical protein